MTDISVFKKILEHPYVPSSCSTTANFVWLTAYQLKGRPGQFVYVVGSRHWPLSKLFTYSLADARAAAESFGVPVRENGPPEAFGREAKAEPSESTIAAFWHLVSLGDTDRLTTWLRDHPQDAPALFKLYLERES